MFNYIVIDSDDKLDVMTIIGFLSVYFYSIILLIIFLFVLLR